MPDISYLIWGEQIVNYLIIALLGLIGLRYVFYYYSFFVHWPRYRKRDIVTLQDLKRLPHIPFIKIQITTRGSQGSSEVIRRGISYLLILAREDPDFYRRFLSIEVITESPEQKWSFDREFALAPISVQVVILPPDYQPPNGTRFKARALHYIVEMRRRGFNRKPGRTVIVHYDEESVMSPLELRRLFFFLAQTDKKLTEGPIYYPLDYFDASIFCRAMEANRPIGCFECRAVMEKGVPLHLHGSNLVVDEDLENELGWDIGTLNGQPFITEDYVFGINAYLKYGSSIFGWHGCVMLEQPPFSIKSAFKQRYRWIVGVLQGLAMMKHLPAYKHLNWYLKLRLVQGTRYRLMTFAFSFPAGIISLLYISYHGISFALGDNWSPLPFPLMLYAAIIGLLWLNAFFIGAWYNVTSIHKLNPFQAIVEMANIVTVAPFASIMESSAAFWAVLRWNMGKRTVSWKITPKTIAADKAALEGKS